MRVRADRFAVITPYWPSVTTTRHSGTPMP
jgi:hypothetical protein